MNNETIMVVEDDLDLCELIRLYLEKNGFRVVTTDRGSLALELFNQTKPNLILLDVMLPGKNGMDVCRSIRLDSKVPIIFISSRQGADDMIKGLEWGGDDYILKPFHPNVLVAKVKAMLRRVKNDEVSDEWSHEHLRYNFKTCELFVNGSPVQLYTKEHQLLQFFLRNPNQVFHSDELYQAIWGWDSYGNANTVMVHIRYLRKKIELEPSEPRYILTVRGFGYKFDPKPGKS